MLKVAAYLRVSTEEQAEQNISIPAQKSRQIAYCQAKEWEIYDFYVDNGCSGKDLDRPEIKRLISDANNKCFDVVLVVKLDRLSRRQQHVMYLLEDIFEPNNISFSSVSENFETNTTMGKAMLGIMAVFAQLERETIVQRVTDAKKEAAKQGRFMGGTILYGYKHNPLTKSLEINESEASIVRFVFNEYLKLDRGYKNIADILTANKVPTHSNAKTWSVATISNMLKNQHYTGYNPHKGELYEGKHDAIITTEQWEAAQKIILKRNHYNPTANNGLLKGIIFCGECGAGIRAKPVNKPNKTIYYYVCYSKDKGAPKMIKDPNCECGYYPVESIESKVIDKLMGYSLRPEVLLTAMKNELKKDDTKQDIPKLIKQAKKETSDIAKRINKWQDAYEVDAVTLEEMRDRTRELKERRLLLENKIKEYEEVLNIIDGNEVSINDLMAEISSFPAIWKEADNDERRSILLRIVTKVFIYKDRSIKINFF